MKRTNIYDINGNWVGWFNLETAKEIASWTHRGGPFEDGKILLATKRGKLVVNCWSNDGRDEYRLADDEREIARILASENGEPDDERLKEILGKYEL